MEHKEALRAQHNQKIYSESEKNNFVREAFAQGQSSFFEVFKPHVDALISRQLLDLIKAYPAVFPDLNVNSVSKE